MREDTCAALTVHRFLTATAGSLENVSSATTTRQPSRASLLTPVPRWYRDAAAVLTWLSLLVVVGLWVSGGGIPAVLDPLSADGLTTLGRITGLVSADLLLVQVLLMSRIPFVERAYGQDELARRHRLVGFWSFNLVLAHVLLITLGYAAGRNVVAEFVTLVLDYPAMLLALAGTLALTLVVVTSIRAARRKLRYEDWHLLHLYAYLGVGLALPHQLWTGQDFLSSPAATVYWWTLWAAAAGAILVWRVGVPLYRSARHGLVVERVVPEAAGVVSVIMFGDDLDKLRASAGQFFTWRFLDGRGWTRGNPYSLSAAPSPTQLRITAKDLGDGSRRLERLKPGTRVLVEGPFGRMHPGVRTRRKVTLLAGGIGRTPVRADAGPGGVGGGPFGRSAPGGPAPPQGHAARRRDRRHAVAGDAGGARAGTGRRDPGLPRAQQARRRPPARDRRPRRGHRRARLLRPRPPRPEPPQLAPAGRRAPGRRQRAAAPRAGRRRPRRLHLRSGALDGSRPRRLPRRRRPARADPPRALLLVTRLPATRKDCHA